MNGWLKSGVFAVCTGLAAAASAAEGINPFGIEEHLYVLDGRTTLHLGDEIYPLSRGCYVCFPAGQALPHYLENDGSEPFRYLMIGERISDDVVIHCDDV